MISHNPFLSTKRGVHSPYTFPNSLAPEFLNLRRFARSLLKNGNQRETVTGNLHHLILPHVVALESFYIFLHFLKKKNLFALFLRDLSTSVTGVIQGVLQLAFQVYTHFPGQENPPPFFTTEHQKEVTNEVRRYRKSSNCCPSRSLLLAIANKDLIPAKMIKAKYLTSRECDLKTFCIRQR